VTVCVPAGVCTVPQWCLQSAVIDEHGLQIMESWTVPGSTQKMNPFKNYYCIK
jgi:hypothetical protein